MDNGETDEIDNNWKGSSYKQKTLFSN
jgi:hypothetical protein